jgi:hypothetical protein
VAAAREANAEARREVTLIRSFRSVLLASAAILTLGAIGLGVLGIVQPDALPLCFHPGNKVVCPTGRRPCRQTHPTSIASSGGPQARGPKLPLVELVGLRAAAVRAAAVSPRGIRGATTPVGCRSRSRS